MQEKVKINKNEVMQDGFHIAGSFYLFPSKPPETFLKQIIMNFSITAALLTVHIFIAQFGGLPNSFMAGIASGSLFAYTILIIWTHQRYKKVYHQTLLFSNDNNVSKQIKIKMYVLWMYFVVITLFYLLKMRNENKIMKNKKMKNSH